MLYEIHVRNYSVSVGVSVSVSIGRVTVCFLSFQLAHP